MDASLTCVYTYSTAAGKISRVKSCDVVKQEFVFSLKFKHQNSKRVRVDNNGGWRGGLVCFLRNFDLSEFLVAASSIIVNVNIDRNVLKEIVVDENCSKILGTNLLFFI